MLNNRTFRLFSTSFFLLFICGCSSFINARRLSWIKSADPKHDCDAAIARGDLRFYAVNGFGPNMVIGTDQDGADRALIQAYGVHNMAGTSDYMNARLNVRATEYVRSYNAALLRYLHAKAPQSLILLR